MENRVLTCRGRAVTPENRATTSRNYAASSQNHAEDPDNRAASSQNRAEDPDNRATIPKNRAANHIQSYLGRDMHLIYHKHPCLEVTRISTPVISKSI